MTVIRMELQTLLHQQKTLMKISDKMFPVYLKICFVVCHNS